MPFVYHQIVRTCPACTGEGDIGLDDDRLSVCSKGSRKSTRSAKSNRSVKSSRSTKSQSKPGKAARSSRYGNLPFDGDGYCCRHPSTQIGKIGTRNSIFSLTLKIVLIFTLCISAYSQITLLLFVIHFSTKENDGRMEDCPRRVP